MEMEMALSILAGLMIATALALAIILVVAIARILSKDIKNMFETEV